MTHEANTPSLFYRQGEGKGDVSKRGAIRGLKKCKPAFVHRSQAEERPGAGLKGATQYTPSIVMEYPAHQPRARNDRELWSTAVYVDMAAEFTRESSLTNVGISRCTQLGNVSLD